MLEAGLYSAIAPFVLLLVSSVSTYPAVLEELVKWGIIRRWPNSGLVVGLIFGLSEAVLFTMNSWQSGLWGMMLTRLSLTVPMHMVTGLVIGRTVRTKWQWVGLAVAMVIHAGFNFWVR